VWNNYYQTRGKHKKIKGVLIMSTGIIIVAIVSMFIWITLPTELVKSSKEDNKEKIDWKSMTLMSIGTVSTLILTLWLFQQL
jgi:hypothetical protein